MNEIPQNVGRQAFLGDLTSAIERRVISAEKIRLLSNRDGKWIEVVQDVTGEQFVRRTYSPAEWGGVLSNGLTFHEAWDAMHRDFARSGLEIIPSFIATLPSQQKEPIVVVSQFVPAAREIMTASVDGKKQLATSLGNMLHMSEEVLPHQQMLMRDMFQVGLSSKGKPSIMLVDVDPYVQPKPSPEMLDSKGAAYINQVSSLFYDFWCRESEREQVLGSFAISLMPLVNQDTGMETMMALSNVNMLKQGLDLR